MLLLVAVRQRWLLTVRLLLVDLRSLHQRLALSRVLLLGVQVLAAVVLLAVVEVHWAAQKLLPQGELLLLVLLMAVGLVALVRWVLLLSRRLLR